MAMTMTRSAGMFGLFALLIGCSQPFKTGSATLTDRQAAELNMSEARSSERQHFWNSAASYYVMAADNYRRSGLPEQELSALVDGQRAALQAWQQPRAVIDQRPLEGGTFAQVEGRLAEYWQERDEHRAMEHYRNLLERQNDVRMLYSAPGLELVKAASRSEKLRKPALTMRLYLFGLSGQHVEDGELYPQLALDFARRHGYTREATQLKRRRGRATQLGADLSPRSSALHEQLRVAAARRRHYANLGEATLAAVYADQETRLAQLAGNKPDSNRETDIDAGLDRLATALAGVGKHRPSRQPAPIQTAKRDADPVNSCIQISSSGPNTVTLINNCSHNVSVAWCYIPAPGALQSDKVPVQGNQICIHNGVDFPSTVLSRSGNGADLSKTYHSWDLPYSQNTIYHIACNAGEDGKALPQVSGFDDNLRGSCPSVASELSETDAATGPQ
jgi:hypothetical protein